MSGLVAYISNWKTGSVLVSSSLMLMSMAQLMTLTSKSRIEELPKCREVQWEEKAAQDCWTTMGIPSCSMDKIFSSSLLTMRAC